MHISLWSISLAFALTLIGSWHNDTQKNEQQCHATKKVISNSFVSVVKKRHDHSMKCCDIIQIEETVRIEASEQEVL